jgi:hypothetical protein
MHRAYRALCALAAAASALVAVLDEFFSSPSPAAPVPREASEAASWPWGTLGRGRVLRWAHALASAVLHLATAAAVRPTSGNSRAIGGIELGASTIVAALVVANVLFVAGVIGLSATHQQQQQQQRHASLGLGAANLLTLGVGAVLRWDQRDSLRAVRDLEGARYRHKSL